MSVVIGVLALQGAFGKHCESLSSLGVTPREVKLPSDLEGVDALILPGGESSTMSNLLTSSGLFGRIASALEGGLPMFGTCAGLILLGTEILDGRPDQRCLGAIDIAVRRNAYGRQVDSFEAELDTELGPVHGVFIRAPRIETVGRDVKVLAFHQGEPVLVQQGTVLGATFHPELSGGTVVHEYFLSLTTKGAR